MTQIPLPFAASPIAHTEASGVFSTLAARRDYLIGIATTAVEAGSCGSGSWGVVFGYDPDEGTFEIAEDEAFDDAYATARHLVPADRESRLPTEAEVRGLLISAGDLYEVGPLSIALALEQLRQSEAAGSPLFRAEITDGLLEGYATAGDDGDYDVVGADGLVQLVCFGEIVYG